MPQLPAPARPSVRAAVLGVAAVLTTGVLAAPAVADAGPAQPSLSTTVTIIPPTAPTGPLVCDYNRISCGTVKVESTLEDLDGFPVGTYVGSLSGTMHLRRVYGCEDASGRRIRSADTVVTQDTSLNTRRGIPFSVPAGSTEVTVDDFAFLDDAQPGTCAAGQTPVLSKIVLSRVRLELDELAAPGRSFGYRVPGSYSWTGSVPTEPAPVGG